MHDVTKPAPAGTRPRVSILVVGYNSAGLLTDCLKSVAPAAQRTPFEILFVNNGTDDSEGLVAREFPQAKVAGSIGNVGFASANNLLAGSAEGDYLLLLNPDTRLAEGSIDQLVDAAEANPDYAILGGATVDSLDADKDILLLQPPSLRYFARSMIGLRAEKLTVREGDKIVETEAVGGHYMMVRAEVWRRLEGLDERFFLYAEEQDMCTRARNAGHKVGIVLASKVLHDAGSGELLSERRLLWMAAGIAEYCRKHYGTIHASCCILALWLVSLNRWIAGSLLAPISPKFAKLSAASGAIARNPSRWIRGFDSPGADPRKGTAHPV
jgi:GT2 family glycosyltransferase